MSQTFSVSGLNCQSCVNHVTGALSALPGVDVVRVDLVAGVTCDNSGCALDAPTGACPGGVLPLTIAAFAATDGNPGGADEFRLVVNTTVTAPAAIAMNAHHSCLRCGY